MKRPTFTCGVCGEVAPDSGVIGMRYDATTIIDVPGYGHVIERRPTAYSLCSRGCAARFRYLGGTVTAWTHVLMREWAWEDKKAAAPRMQRRAAA